MGWHYLVKEKSWVNRKCIRLIFLLLLKGKRGLRNEKKNAYMRVPTQLLRAVSGNMGTAGMERRQPRRYTVH